MEKLKNFIYAGIGLASTTADNIKETVNDLVEKGKISDTEGKKIVDDFFKSTTEMRGDFEERLKSFSSELTEKFEFLKKKNTEVDSLEAKIEELEAKLKEANAKKTTAKKTTTRKTTTARKTTAKKTTTRKPAAKKTAAAK